MSVDNLTYTDFYTTAYKQHEIKAKDSNCFVLKLTRPERQKLQVTSKVSPAGWDREGPIHPMGTMNILYVQQLIQVH